MKKSRYTETQIIKVLKKVEGGRLVKEVCWEYGVSDATYYNWKSKYGGAWTPLILSGLRSLKRKIVACRSQPGAQDLKGYR